ncbi:hypothetical protein AAIB41_02465 [Brucella sp. BE17]|uniref:hypothetical protein n=1 Tax=Brucella sp. BE17 TaxID=3142977 RepID=UPI0031BAA3EF
MQKSASQASLALRLNNLEQKFDDFEVPDPEEPDAGLTGRLAKMTVAGSATSGTGADWSKNTYFFEVAGNPSLSTSLYGEYQYNPTIYQSVSEKPFYRQVFGYSHAGKFSENAYSLSEAVFGQSNLTTDSYVDYFANGEALIHFLFGSNTWTEIESRLEVLKSAGGLFGILFGSATNAEVHAENSYNNLFRCLWGRPEVVEFLTSDLSKDLFNLIFGYSTGSIQSDLNFISATDNRFDLLASVKKMRSDMNYLEERVRFLEIHTGFSLNE